MSFFLFLQQNADSVVSRNFKFYGGINMKKTVKSFAALLLCAVMLLSTVVIFQMPASASSATGWIWPVTGQIFSRGFTSSHLAVDIAAPQGTPVLASREGTVVCAYTTSAAANWKCPTCGYTGAGHHVVIRHADNWYSFYAHLSTVNTAVGVYVPAGQQIGTVGTTGNSTGPHLHFGISSSGLYSLVDPLTYLTPFSSIGADVGANDVTLTGIFADYGPTMQTAGFYIGTSPNAMTKVTETLNTNGYINGVAIEKIFYSLNKWYPGLAKNKVYYYKMYITRDGKEYCSDLASFTYGTVTPHNCDTDKTWNAGVVKKAATCAYTGEKVYTCTVCSKTKTEVIPKTAHTYGEWHVVRDATINEEGLSCRVCSVCEASETKTLPKLAHTHSFTGGEEIVTPASCTAEGSKKVYCSNPDCTEYELVIIPKTGHTDHWKVIKEATCTDEGTRSNECSVCGKVLGTEKTAKKGHDYKVSVVPPTETEQGYTLHKCKVCGDEYKDNYTAPIDENAVKITVESKKAFAGKTVLVNVILENNPGIWGMDLAVSYDRTKLTLNSVTNGEVFADSEWTKGNLSAESYILSYEANGFENVSGSGVLATLEFTVNDEAQAEDFYEISVSYRSGDIIDAAFAEISPAVVQGGVQVIDVLYGDLNGDGIVNKKDSLLMKMYLADNTTQINEAAADVFPDGAINKKDSLYLKQYLAGLDVELGA